MRRSFFIVVISMYMIACSRGPKVPKGVLQPDKMEDVLWDMIQTGEFLSGFVLYRDTNINAVLESQRWYEKVYSFHQISKEDFKRSYNWYRDHPDMMKRILDSLSVRKDPEPAPTIQTDTTAAAAGDTLRRRNDSLAGVIGDKDIQPLPANKQVMDSLRARRKRAIQGEIKVQ